VADDFVGGGVLAEVVADVFALDFDRYEFLAVVNPDGEPDELGEHDHVAVVGADDDLLALHHELVGLTKPFEQLLLARAKPAAEAAALPAGQQVDELVHGHPLQVVQFETAIRELLDHVSHRQAATQWMPPSPFKSFPLSHRHGNSKSKTRSAVFSPTGREKVQKVIRRITVAEIRWNGDTRWPQRSNPPYW